VGRQFGETRRAWLLRRAFFTLMARSATRRSQERGQNLAFVVSPGGVDISQIVIDTIRSELKVFKPGHDESEVVGSGGYGFGTDDLLIFLLKVSSDLKNVDLSFNPDSAFAASLLKGDMGNLMWKVRGKTSQ
jgi:hypothetical protein